MLLGMYTAQSALDLKFGFVYIVKVYLNQNWMQMSESDLNELDQIFVH